jgi:hypothetical protein
MSWRLQQLSTSKGYTIKQDADFFEFVKSKNIQSIVLQGEPDIDYFRSQLPNCSINESNPGMFAVFVNELGNKLEDILETVSQQVVKYNPKWVYIAVNKYLITTDLVWTDLTDNYDLDLLTIVNRQLTKLHYQVIKQSYIAEDFGQYFNFSHPTTNIFYERINAVS